jgi:ABC-type sugar transport system substrate-binding protein
MNAQKYRNKRIICFFAVLCAMLSGCLSIAQTADVDSHEDTTTEETIRIISFLPGQSNMSQITGEITEGLREGMASADNASLTVYNFEDFGNSGFYGAVETFIAMQGDVMIAFGVSDVSEAEDLIKENHVKLILLDTDTTGDLDERIAFIGTDNQTAVQNIMNDISQKISEINMALFLTYEHSTTVARLDEVLKFADADSDIDVSSVSYLSSNSIDSYKQMMEILEENSDINTIICLDGFSSQTAASVIPAVDHDYYIAGFDENDETIEALENGTFDLLVTQNYHAMGKLAVGTALSYKDGDKPIEIYEPSTLYTAEDAEKLVEVYFSETK